MMVQGISKKFKVAKSTVPDTIQAERKGRPHQKSKPRGAHRKIIITEDRRIVRAAVSTPDGRRQTLCDIHINIAPHVSPSTIRRRLREQRIRKWRAAGRIKITEDIAKARLGWARKQETGVFSVQMKSLRRIVLEGIKTMLRHLR